MRYKSTHAGRYPERFRLQVEGKKQPRRSQVAKSAALTARFAALQTGELSGISAMFVSLSAFLKNKACRKRSKVGLVSKSYTVVRPKLLT
jgi:hypothetical protein